MAHYVNNKEFLRLILEYQEKLKQNPNEPIPKPILKTIQKMIDKIASRGNFCRYRFLDDMKQEAWIFALGAITKFNPEKSKNPFAYFTSVIWNAFIGVIMREKEYVKTKFEYVQLHLPDKAKKRDYRPDDEAMKDLEREYTDFDVRHLNKEELNEDPFNI